MKSFNKLLIINAIALIMLFCTFYSCQKYDLDFSDVNSADLNGEWGIPFVNSTYTAGEVLEVLNSENFTPRPDGMLQYVYDLSVDNVIKGEELLTMNDNLYVVKNYEFTIPPSALGYTIPINGRTFSETLIIDNRLFQIRNGEVKSGTLKFHVSHDVPHIDSIVITTHNLLNANQQFFKLVMQNVNSDQYINLSGYKIIANNDSVQNAVTFTTKIYGSVSSSLQAEDYFVDLAITAMDLKLKYVYGKMKPQYVDVSQKVPVRVFSDNFSGSVNLLSPVYHIKVENSFGSQLGFVVDTAGFADENAHYSPVMRAGAFVTCQAAPNRGVFVRNHQQYSQNSVYYNEDMNSFILSGKIVVNPHGFSAGNIFVDENSTINIHTDLEIPFQANVDFLEFRDTTGNILEALRSGGSNNYTDAIQKITMKCDFLNGLPTMLDAQLYFVDTTHTQYVVIDSLLAQPRLLTSAITDADGKVTSPTFTTAMVEIAHEKLDRILNQSNNTLLKFRIHTDQAVKVYSSQFLKAKIGLKVEYDTENVTIEF